MTDSSEISGPPAADGQQPPRVDPPAERLLQLMQWTGAASRQLRRRVAEVATGVDLSDAELLVVWLCHGNGHVQVELAGAIGISPAQMSGLVERLRLRGLVEMHRQALDRRRQVWCTSPAGEALLRNVAARLEDLAAAIDSVISGDEQQALQLRCEQIAEVVNPQARRTAGNARTNAPDEQRGSKEAA